MIYCTFTLLVLCLYSGFKVVWERHSHCSGNFLLAFPLVTIQWDHDNTCVPIKLFFGVQTAHANHFSHCLYCTWTLHVLHLSCTSAIMYLDCTCTCNLHVLYLYCTYTVIVVLHMHCTFTAFISTVLEWDCSSNLLIGTVLCRLLYCIALD